MATKEQLVRIGFQLNGSVPAAISELNDLIKNSPHSIAVNVTGSSAQIAPGKQGGSAVTSLDTKNFETAIGNLNTTLNNFVTGMTTVNTTLSQVTQQLSNVLQSANRGGSGGRSGGGSSGGSGGGGGGSGSGGGRTPVDPAVQSAKDALSVASAFKAQTKAGGPITPALRRLGVEAALASGASQTRDLVLAAKSEESIRTIAVARQAGIDARATAAKQAADKVAKDKLAEDRLQRQQQEEIHRQQNLDNAKALSAQKQQTRQNVVDFNATRAVQRQAEQTQRDIDVKKDQDDRLAIRQGRTSVAQGRLSIAQNNLALSQQRNTTGVDPFTGQVKRQSVLDAEEARRNKILKEFEGNFTGPGEVVDRLFGNKAGAAERRQARIQTLINENPKLAGLDQALNQSTKSPDLFSAGRLGSREALTQVGFAGIFGSRFGGPLGAVSGIAGAAIGGAIAGAPGALAASTIQQTVAGVIVEPILNAFNTARHKFEEAGETFSRSILGISSVLQASTTTIGGSIPGQLAAQERRAVAIQTAARARILPLGVGAQAEATTVQGIISALASRGLIGSPEQIATLAERITATVQAQQPQLLENPARFLRDIEDFVTGGPAATRTTLGQLAGIRQAIPGVRAAGGVEDLVRATNNLSGFVDAIRESTNIVALQRKQEAAQDILATAGGTALLEATRPGLKAFTDALNTESTKEAAVALGTTLGELASAGLEFKAKMVDFTASVINATRPVIVVGQEFARFIPAIITAALSLKTISALGSLSFRSGAGAAVAGGAVGAAGLALAAAEAFTAIEEEKAQRADRESEETKRRTEFLQGGRAEIDPTLRTQTALRRVGLEGKIEDITKTLITGSTANQLATITAQINQQSPFIKGNLTGALQLQDQLSAANFKERTGFLSAFPEGQAALEALFGRTEGPRATTAAQEAQTASREDFLSARTTIGTTESRQKDLDREADRRRRFLSVAQQDEERANEAVRIEEQRQQQEIQRLRAGGGGVRVVGGGEVADLAELTNIRQQASVAREQASLEFAQAKAIAAEGSKADVKLAEKANLFVEAQEKVLAAKESELAAQQNITRLALQTAEAFKSSFLSATPTGARGLASFEAGQITKALASQSKVAERIQDELDQATAQREDISALIGTTTDEKALGALQGRAGALDATIEALQERQTLAPLQRQQLLNRALENAITQSVSGSGLQEIRSRQAGINTQTFAGAEEAARLRAQEATIQAQASRGILAAGSISIGGRNIGLTQEQKEFLGTEQSRFGVEAVQQNQARVQAGFTTQEGRISLAKSLQDSANLLTNENILRKEVNDQLTGSKLALASFNTSLEARTAASESSAVSLVKQAKELGLSTPIGFDLSDDRLQSLKKTEVQAKANEALFNLTGIENLVTGAQSAGALTRGFSPQEQANEIARNKAESSVAKAQQAFEKLPLDIDAFRVALRKTIDDLTFRLGGNTGARLPRPGAIRPDDFALPGDGSDGGTFPPIDTGVSLPPARQIRSRQVDDAISSRAQTEGSTATVSKLDQVINVLQSMKEGVQKVVLGEDSVPALASGTHQGFSGTLTPGGG